MMLKIDSEGMEKALMAALYEECEVLTNWLWMQVRGEAPAEVDRNQLFQEVAMVAGNKVIGRVSAGGMMALVTEWGSGSKADTSNPAWNEYVNSRFWNPMRDPGKHTIRGRPEGEYVDLDYETRYSSGKKAGINLEWKYPPQEPQHWMRKIVELSTPFILERLEDTVRLFPFRKFIYSDIRAR